MAPPLPVPHVPQCRDDDCGTACLRSVLRYYAVAELPEAFAQLDSIADGLTPAELCRGLTDNGLAVHEIHGMTIDQLAERIADGNPVLCPVSLDGGHWVCVVGVDDDCVAYLDPHCGSAQLTVADWLAAWHDVDRHGNRCERLGIVVGCVATGAAEAA